MKEEEVLFELGKRVRQRRIELRMKVSEVAQRVELNPKTISKLENGGSVTTLHLMKILKVLGALDHFDCILPKEDLSPRDIIKYKKRQVPSAQRVRDRQSNSGEWSW
jgi:transcriptional regulator with XRE-family HTH domain